MCHITVNVVVAGDVHHHKIGGTVLSSMHAWMCAKTTVTWSPTAACSRLFAATTGNAWSPMVLCNDRGTCNAGDDTESRRQVMQSLLLPAMPSACAMTAKCIQILLMDMCRLCDSRSAIGCIHSQLTWKLTLASRRTSRLDIVYVLPLHRRWLSAVCGWQLPATECLPSLVFGTVCRSMSHPHHHCLSSAVAWRHISLQVLLSLVAPTVVTVVPEKRHGHSGHINHSCYLLAYLTRRVVVRQGPDWWALQHLWCVSRRDVSVW